MKQTFKLMMGSGMEVRGIIGVCVRAWIGVGIGIAVRAGKG